MDSVCPFWERHPTRQEVHNLVGEDAPRHRFCIVLRGDPAKTAHAAQAVLHALPQERVLWIGGGAVAFPAVAPAEVRRRLGQAFDAVVLDLHGGLDADVLGQCAAMVWGGGRLLLRMPQEGTIPQERLDELVVYPYQLTEVGTRLWRRFERCLSATSARVSAVPLEPVSHFVHADAQQAAVVTRLCAAFLDDAPSLLALIADRGRGKSSALGLALQRALGKRSLRVAVSASNPVGAAEIFRFAVGSPAPPTTGCLVFVTPQDLAHDLRPFDVIVIDEAAQLPVPLLVAITRRHKRARMAFSTTARGYEGTGRGFVLRFLAWARKEGRPLTELSLTQPIRWDIGDPLEQFVDSALALDAQPADLFAAEWAPKEVVKEVVKEAPLPVEHVVLDRENLAHNEALLRDFFGLLVHAHYRTTPADLSRILDAPNLILHALLWHGRVVAASVLAREGGLSSDLCTRLAAGAGRIRGHALPDTLISHTGQTEAGLLTMIRSVRIAVHPALRRRGLAARLVDHIHAWHAKVDLFGTVFGATSELLAFRRALGYELVRLGASLGSRTGEPAAVMLRPVSDRAHRLLAQLRLDLARNLPLQLALLRADGEACLCEDLAVSAQQGLPIPPPLDESTRDDLFRRYLSGPQPLDAAIAIVRDFVTSHNDALCLLSPCHKTLIESRVIHLRSFARAAAEAKLPSVPAAMRALRPALRQLYDLARQSESQDRQPTRSPGKTSLRSA